MGMTIYIDLLQIFYGYKHFCCASNLWFKHSNLIFGTLEGGHQQGQALLWMYLGYFDSTLELLVGPLISY